MVRTEFVSVVCPFDRLLVEEKEISGVNLHVMCDDQTKDK